MKCLNCSNPPITLTAEKSQYQVEDVYIKNLLSTYNPKDFIQDVEVVTENPYLNISKKLFNLDLVKIFEIVDKYDIKNQSTLKSLYKVTKEKYVENYQQNLLDGKPNTTKESEIIDLKDNLLNIDDLDYNAVANFNDVIIKLSQPYLNNYLALSFIISNKTRKDVKDISYILFAHLLSAYPKIKEVGNGCSLCNLSKKTNINNLEGWGNKQGKYLILLDSPVFVDGKNHINHSIEILNLLMSQAKINQHNSYITYCIRCPQEGTTNKSSLRACKTTYLDPILKNHKFKAIITVGRIGLKMITGISPKSTTDKDRYEDGYVGKYIWSPTYNTWVFPVYGLKDIIVDKLVFKCMWKQYEMVKLFNSLEYIDQKPVPKDNFNIHLAENKDDVKTILNYYKDISTISIDIETEGFDTKFNTGKITTISLTSNLTESHVFKYEFLDDELKKLCKEVLTGKTLIGHNIKFDAKWLKFNNLLGDNKLWDTILAYHLINENGPFGLKELSCFFTSMGTYDDYLDEYREQNNLDKNDYTNIPYDILGFYNGIDTYVTYKLYLIFQHKLQEIAEKQNNVNYNVETLFNNVTMPLVDVLIDMEMNGFKVDMPYLKIQGDKWKIELVEILNYIKEEAKKHGIEDLNPDSSQQLQVLLYEKLGLPVLKKTKTGASTDNESLEYLFEQTKSSLVEKLISFKKLGKMVSTFIDGLTETINLGESRVFPEYSIHGTVTGRTSCHNPNLQQLPRNDAIKNAFIPEEGHYLIEADYSQAELRVAAHLCKDEKLVEYFNAGFDVHAKVAADVFGLLENRIIPLEEVKKEMRQIAKGVNFGLLYGRGFKSIAEEVGIDPDTAKTFVDTYFSIFKGMANWRYKEMKVTVPKLGYATNIFGRIRRLPNINHDSWMDKGEAERQAINFPCQASAADCTYLGMVKVHKWAKENNIPMKFLATIHDSCLISCETHHIKMVLVKMKELMEHVYPFSIPFIADIEVYDKWKGKHITLEELEKETPQILI